MRATKILLSIAVLLFGLAAPAAVFAQGEAGRGSATGPTDESEDEPDKNWSIRGKIASRVGQGTFVNLENDSEVEGEQKPVGQAFDRVNMVYTLNPTYDWKEFKFGAEFQLVHWLTSGGGIYGIPAAGGANDASAVYFQDITLSGKWKGHTFDSIGLTLAPSLEIGLPTHKYSRNNTKYFDASGSLALTKRFFERVTFQGQIGAAKYFYRYKTPAVSLDRVGDENVLYRPGEAEDLGNGLVSIGGYNLSHSFSAGAAANVEIVDRLSASISYFFINFYSYQGPDRDEFTADAAQPGTNLSQVVSTGVSLSYETNDWLSLNLGTGSYMSPKTADNKSFRFPFWNTQGAAANRSWLELGATATY